MAIKESQALYLLIISLVIALLYAVTQFIAETPGNVTEHGYMGYTPALVGGAFSLYIAVFFLKAVCSKNFKAVL